MVTNGSGSSGGSASSSGGTSRGIGADLQRVDGVDKVMGRPIFGADRVLPGMAHAVPVAATVGKGRLVRIDTAEAERTPGVLLVLTAQNMDRLQQVAFLFAGGQATQSLQPMQSDQIAYRGQPVALVVAESLEAAREGAALVRAEYEAAPFAVRFDEPGSETVLQAQTMPWFKDFVVGDADGALRSAPVVVDETYSTPAQHQNPIELLGTVAVWNGDQLTIHEGTQASQSLCQGLATALGIDAGKVRVLAPFAGGGFGQKNSLSFHTVLAAVAARRVGRPVKLVVPRAQVFHGTSFRAAARHRVKLGADASGRLLAGVQETDAQTSRHDLMPFTGAKSTSRLYGIPNYRGMARLVRLDTQTPGFMRAPFEMSAFFGLESAMDELAEKLGIDPVQLRLSNDTQVDPISGKPYTLRRLKECLQRGADRFGWAQRTPRPGSMRDPDGTLIGWGMAAGAYPALTAPAIANVRLNADATADVSVGGHEMGQGLRTAIALVAAEALGIDPTRVRITIGDTIAPPQHLTAGAWGTATATPAVQEAAQKVRAQFDELARSQGARAAASAVATGAAASAGVASSASAAAAGRGMSVAEVLGRAAVPHLEARVERLAPGQTADALAHAGIGAVAAAGPEYPDFVAFSYVAHFVEVRVDPRIRRARVSRIVTVIDCGRVVSRRTARSQVYGGLVWSVGAALTEESEVDPRFGGFLNANIAEYQVPVNGDIRRFEVDFIDEPDPRFNAVGAKGLGEVACVGAAAAIANAVYHATGTRVRDLPIHIEKLLA
jgi:xanthine dehydrogenase YagR molybdenum-binding subunit